VAEALKRIADAGFEHVELCAIPVWCPHVDIAARPDGQGEQLAALTKELGLTVVGMNSVPWIPDALDDPAELKARFTAAADVAAAIGAPVWVIDGGQPLPEERGGRPAAVERWRANVVLAAELAKERGIKLAVETPHRGTIAESVEGAVALLHEAGVEGLGMDYDTSHVYNAGTSVADSLDLAYDRIAHVALRDAKPDGSFCAPGDGGYDFAALVAALRQRGYGGDLVLELETAGELSTDEIVDEAVRSHKLIADLLAR
jgi:inosose dehydratase